MPVEGAHFAGSMMKKRDSGTGDGKQMTCPKRLLQNTCNISENMMQWQ
jgi:hypothetical protein